jgi:exopolysaccharide biosynthesis operon protein EpsL
MLLRSPLLCLSFGPLLLSGAAPAWAMVGDTFTLNAAYTRQTDSNLFRLPAGANVNALIGKSSAAEEIGSTSLGFNLNKAYSLQRLELSVNLINNQYQNFNYLDYTARNYRAAWRWSVTPRLHGSLSTDRQETLNSFADFQGFNQRNQRTSTNTRLDAAYDLYGAWQLVAGVSQSRQANQQAVLGEGDYNSKSADLGLRFAYASGSALSYTVKSTNGSYLNRVLPSSGAVDDGFNQIDQGLNLHWVISGKSGGDASATYINRSYPNFGQLDYSGLTTAVNFNWSITGKSALTAGLSRALSSYQSSNVSYTQTDNFSISPTWQVSPKTTLRLRHQLIQTNYLGSPTGASAVQRRDTNRDTSLSFDWQPYQNLTLSASLQKASRASNVAGVDYDSNMTTLSTQFTF